MSIKIYHLSIKSANYTVHSLHRLQYAHISSDNETRTHTHTHTRKKKKKITPNNPANLSLSKTRAVYFFCVFIHIIINGRASIKYSVPRTEESLSSSSSSSWGNSRIRRSEGMERVGWRGIAGPYIPLRPRNYGTCWLSRWVAGCPSWDPDGPRNGCWRRLRSLADWRSLLASWYGPKPMLERTDRSPHLRFPAAFDPLSSVCSSASTESQSFDWKIAGYIYEDCAGADWYILNRCCW